MAFPSLLILSNRHIGRLWLRRDGELRQFAKSPAFVPGFFLAWWAFINYVPWKTESIFINFVIFALSIVLPFQAVLSRGTTAFRRLGHSQAPEAVVEAIHALLEKSGFEVRDQTAKSIRATRKSGLGSSGVAEKEWRQAPMELRVQAESRGGGSEVLVTTTGMLAFSREAWQLTQETCAAIAALDGLAMKRLDETLIARQGKKGAMGGLATTLFAMLSACALLVGAIAVGVAFTAGNRMLEILGENEVEREARSLVAAVRSEIYAPVRLATRRFQSVPSVGAEALMSQLSSAFRDAGVHGELVAAVRIIQGPTAVIHPPQGHPLHAPLLAQLLQENRGPRPFNERLFVPLPDIYTSHLRQPLGLQKNERLRMGLVMTLDEFRQTLPRFGEVPDELVFFDGGKAVVRIGWQPKRGERGVLHDISMDTKGSLPDDVVVARMQGGATALSKFFGNSLLFEKKSAAIRLEERDGRLLRVAYEIARDGGVGSGWYGTAVGVAHEAGDRGLLDWVTSEALSLGASFFGFAVIAVALIVFPFVSNRITRPVVELRDALRAIASGDYSVRVAATRTDEIGQLQKLLNQAAVELQRREAIKDLFGKYLSKQVAEKIIESDSKQALAGLRREVSILFADVRGFTTYSERHDPEEVTKSLNEYFEVMVDVITAHDGVLDKYIGDGLMVVFGAPMAQPDHAKRAVITALEMQAALQSLNLKRAQRGDEPIHIGIGVNTGQAISGNLGSIKRMEFTVIGDTVNLAARLENRAQIGQILIGAGTHRKVSDLIEAESLGQITVKGRSEAVDVWALKGLKVKKDA